MKSFIGLNSIGMSDMTKTWLNKTLGKKGLLTSGINYLKGNTTGKMLRSSLAVGGIIGGLAMFAKGTGNLTNKIASAMTSHDKPVMKGSNLGIDSPVNPLRTTAIAMNMTNMRRRRML